MDIRPFMCSALKAFVYGLSSTACFGHDTQLYGVSTASEQVPVPYRLKDPYGGTLAIKLRKRSL